MRQKDDSIDERLGKFPPGLVGVATAFIGRYREFDACYNSLWLPEGSQRKWFMGADPGAAFNNMGEELLKDPSLQWLWILGDDHDFSPDLLLILLERKVDIIVPLCLHRQTHTPVLNYGEDQDFVKLSDPWKSLEGLTGLVEWYGTVGNAGMLIQRHVLEEMQRPWFKQGQLDPKYSSSDLYFSWHAQKYGYKIHLDLDNFIGHIDHISIWPRHDENGKWFVDTMVAGSCLW